MLSNVVRDRRAWQADNIGDAESWRHRLPDDLFAILENRLQEGRITGLLLDEATQMACRAMCSAIFESLEHGPGFAVLDGLSLDRYSLAQAQALYWLWGQCLGRPLEQNIEGTLLYDVHDKGRNVVHGARFSVTNAESSFHTDNSFGAQVPEYVGLLCLKTATSGGRSQLVSAYTLHNELLANHPDVLKLLYSPFYFDRRGQFREGEEAYSRHPVFEWDGLELKTRYLHYYIQVGHERSGQALTSEQQMALEVLQNLLHRKDLRVEFVLQPGQMLFTNNLWVLHNRTAFRDSTDPLLRRHYVRLWLLRATGLRTRM